MVEPKTHLKKTKYIYIYKRQIASFFHTKSGVKRKKNENSWDNHHLAILFFHSLSPPRACPEHHHPVGIRSSTLEEPVLAVCVVWVPNRLQRLFFGVGNLETSIVCFLELRASLQKKSPSQSFQCLVSSTSEEAPPANHVQDHLCLPQPPSTHILTIARSIRRKDRLSEASCCKAAQTPLLLRFTTVPSTRSPTTKDNSCRRLVKH